MEKQNSFHELPVSIDDDYEDNSEDENSEEHNTPLIDGHLHQKLDPISLSIGKIRILKPQRRKARFRKVLLYFMFFVFVFLFLYYFLKNGFDKKNDFNVFIRTVKNCDSLHVTNVWNHTFPMLAVESALRLVDVNKDGILDVIIAFGTGADAAYYPTVVCQVYFNQTENSAENGCGGGIMALEGKTGAVLWTRYTKHELFAVNCNFDLTDDQIFDCVVGGRMASLFAIDGSNGNIIWTVDVTMREPICETSNFYTPLFVSKDVDEDGVNDLVVMHGGDPLRRPTEPVRLPARLIVMSAKTGLILTWSLVPDNAESYYSPQELKDENGFSRILFGTGGETHRGSLYLVALEDLLQGNMKKAKIIYFDCCKGIMVPPVLIDLNNDTVLDIVMSAFNSTVVAINGRSLAVIWKTVFPQSETYSTPAVGYFNNDTTPDFLVMHQHGPGFPIYHYTEANILNGKDGKPLLYKPIKMLIGTQSSPLTISSDGGTDLFLFWLSSCKVNESMIDENTEPFRIMPGTNVHDASRADFCGIRFNSSLYTKLIALSQHFESDVYDSTLSEDTEIVLINYTEIGRNWLQSHSEPRQVNDDYYYNQQAYPRRTYPQYDVPSWRSQDSRYERTLSKRHVGLHDANGVQRVISTGTLCPSSKGEIDIVFATYWFPPSRNVQLMPAEMQRCVDQYMVPEVEANIRLLIPNSKFYGFDHDSYEEFVFKVCRQETKQTLTVSEEQFYNPFGRQMGSMTVYRKNLRCSQKSFKKFEEQIWPSYLGAKADSIANV